MDAGVGAHFEGSTCRISGDFNVKGDRTLYLQLEELEAWW